MTLPLKAFFPLNTKSGFQCQRKDKYKHKCVAGPLGGKVQTVSQQNEGSRFSGFKRRGRLPYISYTDTKCRPKSFYFNFFLAFLSENGYK